MNSSPATINHTDHGAIAESLTLFYSLDEVRIRQEHDEGSKS